MHELLVRQIASSRRQDGSIDVQALLASVSATYDTLPAHDAIVPQATKPPASDLERLVEGLSEQRDRLAAVINNLDHGVALFERDDTLIVSNHQFARNFFLAPEDIGPGIHILDIVRKSVLASDHMKDEDVERTRLHLANVRAQGFLSHVWQRRNGDFFTIKVRVLADGRWLLSHADITQQQTAENLLRDSDQRFREFTKVATDWCWETDENHVFTYSSGPTKFTKGFDPDKVIGRSCLESIARSPDKEVVAAHIEDIKARRPFSNFIFRTVSPDNIVAWVCVSGLPRYDAEERFLGYRGVSRDISEQKELEISLQQSEQRFRDFSEAASDWCWEFDENEDTIFFLRPTLPGVEPDKFARRQDTFREMLQRSPDQAAVAAHLEDIAARRPFTGFVHRSPDLDGSMRWLSISGKPRFDEAGRYIGYRGATRDITAQKLAELSAQQSEQRFRDFTEAASDWCWESDENGCLSFYSLPDNSLLAKEVQKQQGLTIHELLQRHSQAVDFASHLDVIQNQRPFQDFVHTFSLPDGTTRWLCVSGKPHYDEAGRFLGYRGATRDITAQKLAEIKLQESEQRFRDFTECASDWCWEFGEDEKMVVFLEPENAEEFGNQVRNTEETIRELLGRSPDKELVAERLRDIAEHRPFRSFIHRMPMPNGGMRWLSVSGKPRFDDNGRYLGYRGATRDITPQKQLELSVQESEQRFRDFTDSASDWCWETDENHIYTFLTSTLEGHTGFDPVNFVGKKREPIADHPDDQDVVDAIIQAQAEHRPFRQLAFRRATPTGGFIWIKINGLPRFDENGTFLGYRGTGKLVTNEEEQRQKLNHLVQVLKSFVQSSSDWFWETDEQHRFCNVRGVDPGVIELSHLVKIGSTRRDFDVHPDDRGIIEQNMRDLDSHKPFRDLRFRIMRETGQYHWLHVRGNPIFDDNGVFRGYRGTATDVTDEALRQDEANRQSLALERSQALARIGHCHWLIGTQDMEFSNSLYDLLGYDRNRRPPSVTAFISRVHLADRDNVLRLLMLAAQGNPVDHCEYRFSPRDGSPDIHCRMKILVEFDNGTPKALFGIIQDITDLKRTEMLLAQRSQELLEAQRLGKIGDWSCMRHAEEMVWGHELYDLLKLDRNTFVPTLAATEPLYIGDGYERMRQSQIEVLETGEIRSLDVKILRGDGTVGDFVVTTRAVKNASGEITAVAGTLQDISERKQAEEQLAKLAYYDPLTGLANRALFQRHMKKAVAEAARTNRSMTLLLLDLDRFKEVNDSLGHAAGDELLHMVSQILRSHVGPDHFLARLGGDEFALLVTDAGSDTTIETIANTVIERLTQPIHLERGEVNIGVSIGAAIIPQDGHDTETLVRHADLALYQAKEEGRGRLVFFRPYMNTAAQNRVALERDLRLAITDFTGIEARYQPQIDLRTDQVVGFETLMRWKHPTRGYVPPNEFIPIAENSGMIGALGLWILRESIQQGMNWIRQGEVAREISVNLSAAQIWQTDIAFDIAKVLSETGFPPHLLCLELTESLFADHSADRVCKTLQALKRLGVMLAIDDFGTGYSSLGYLNQHLFDKLKIDRVFVDGIVESNRKRRLLEGIVALGHGLGMTVVAEGAEKPEEVRMLREFGCDWVQGYVFARPSVPEDALAYARERETMKAQLPVLTESPSLAPAAQPLQLTKQP